MTCVSEEPPDGWYQPERLEPEPAEPEPTDRMPVDREGDALILRAGTVIEGFPVGKGHGVLGRAPAVVLGDPPARRAEKDLPGGRRPVVALIDTVVGREVPPHPWLAPTDGEPFVEEADWEPSGRNVPPPRAIGDVDSVGPAAGHGTFIAGLIRQVAPDAKVLMLRAMHADGKVYDHHLRDALEWLLMRVRMEKPSDFVDVICLALGYHKGNDPRDDKFTDELRHLLGELGNLGVRVVASAGNDPERRQRIYPAALAIADNRPATSLVSVGSFDPDGVTPSAYSIEVPWMTDREIGTAVVSTIPAFNGPRAKGDPTRQPEEATPKPNAAAAADRELESFDPDDFTCGFARWSGTSFAAGIFAGRLAHALVTPVLGDPRLDAHQRAAAALGACTACGRHR